MDIHGINGINKINQIKKQKQVSESKRIIPQKTDSVEVSDKARHMAELEKVREAVKAAPDIRIDKVNAAKEKIKNGTLISKAVINEIAERIVDNLGM